jgi:hypothetical protein
MDSQSLSGLTATAVLARATPPPEDAGPMPKTPTSEQAEATQLLQAAWEGIRGAIDRLYRLGTTIRMAPTSDLESRVQRFAGKANGDHAFFERIALIVRGLYPSISDSFVQQLAGSVSFRRQRLLYQKCHQKKLETTRRPQPKPEMPVEPIRHDEMSQPALRLNKHQTRRMGREARSSAPSRTTVTRPSAIDPRWFQLNVAEKAEVASGPPTVTSIAHSNPYPPPPKLQGDEKYCRCDWCFTELKVPDDKTRWKHVWRYAHKSSEEFMT